VNAPPALAARSSSPVLPPSADEELGLADLLDLFTTDEPAAAPPAPRSLRSSLAQLRASAQQWVQRATAWGAGPGGAWRAW
jgi:hypothetical protein